MARWRSLSQQRQQDLHHQCAGLIHGGGGAYRRRVVQLRTSLLVVCTAGFSVGRSRKKMGWWGRPDTELFFSIDCRVPAENLAWRNAGRACIIFTQSERSTLAAMARPRNWLGGVAALGASEKARR